MQNNEIRKDFLRSSLRFVTVQICHSLGWHGITRSSLDVLTDILERYMKQLSKTSASYCNNYCRTDPNLRDVVCAFKDLSINIYELEDFIRQVEQAPPKHVLPSIPVETSTSLLSFENDEQFPLLPDVLARARSQENQISATIKTEDAVTSDTSSGLKNRPKDLIIRAESIESPPYSPLEPKLLNADAQGLNAMTRPGLKVTTPKGYTPTTTHSPTVSSFEANATLVDFKVEVEPIADIAEAIVLARKASYKQDEKTEAKEKSPNHEKRSLLLSPVRKNSRASKKSPKEKSPKEQIPRLKTNTVRKPKPVFLMPSDEKPSLKQTIIPLKGDIISPMKVLQSFEKPEVKREIPKSPPSLSLPPQVLLSPVASEIDSTNTIKCEDKLQQSRDDNITPKTPVTLSHETILSKVTKQESSSLNSPKESPRHKFDSPPNLQPTPSPVAIKSEPLESEAPVLVNPVPKEMPVLRFQRNSQSTVEEEIDSPPHLKEEPDSEVDIVSTFDNTFRPDLLPPSLSHVIANVEEKRKKKKKKSDKDRDERKSKDTKEKREKKKKRDDPFVPLKLTLKMGGGAYNNDTESKLVLPSRQSPSPTSSEATLISPQNVFSPPPTSHSAPTTSKSSSRKTKKKEKEPPAVKTGGFYVETLAHTSTTGGNVEVYYCPGCGRPDDGSAMIGCDNCDLWYHWPCVNITVEPAEDTQWYCPKCSVAPPAKKKKKKRKKDNS